MTCSKHLCGFSGRSIIQMARKPTGEKVALKLFTTQQHFKKETQAYQRLMVQYVPQEGQLASQTLQVADTPPPFLNSPLLICESYDNTRGEHKDLFGQPLPPCIAMQCGIRLSDRTERCKLDIFEVLKVVIISVLTIAASLLLVRCLLINSHTLDAISTMHLRTVFEQRLYVQVVHDVAGILKDMHAVGIVHRDVKPSHIVQHPKTQAWTLIDFSSAATLGENITPEFTLQYASPEAVSEQGEGMCHKATTGLDAWSLGVVAYELLTGQPWTTELDVAQVLPRSFILMVSPSCRSYFCVFPSTGAQYDPVNGSDPNAQLAFKICRLKTRTI